MSAHDIGYLLTAYAEDSLTAEGRAWVEAQLQTRPELRDQLDEIRSVRAGLLGALPDPPIVLDASRRARLSIAAMHRPRRRAFAVGRRWISTLAAACLVLGVLLWSTRGHQSPSDQPEEGGQTAGSPGRYEESPTTVAKISSSTRAEDRENFQLERLEKKRSDHRDARNFLGVGSDAKDERIPDQMQSVKSRLQSASVRPPESADTVDQPALKPSSTVDAPYPSDSASAGDSSSIARQESSSTKSPIVADAGPVSPSGNVNANDEVSAEEGGGSGMAQANPRSGPLGGKLSEIEKNKQAPVDSAKESLAVEESLGHFVESGREEAVADMESSGNGEMHLGYFKNEAWRSTDREKHAAYPSAPAEDERRARGSFGDLAQHAAPPPVVRPDMAGQQTGHRTESHLDDHEDHRAHPVDSQTETTSEREGGFRWSNSLPDDLAMRYRELALGASEKSDTQQKRLETDKVTVGNLSAGKDHKQVGAARDAETISRSQAIPSSPTALGAVLARPDDRSAIDDAAVIAGAAERIPLRVDAAVQRRLQARGASSSSPGTGATMGQRIVSTARRSGLQVRVHGTGLEITEPRGALDPTDDQGLDAQTFRAAFGTVPMQSTALVERQTFAIDADTASYAHARSLLARGELPDPGSIQPEHFINAMPTDYPPATGTEPFALYAEAAPSPFAAGPAAARTALVAIGAVARSPLPDERRPLHLTLAVDCSGSMAQAGGLDRVQAGLRTLVSHLRADDRVSLVAFADQARVVLPPTSGAEAARIDRAIATLSTSGSTNCAEGLALAYQLAAESCDPAAENRVLLATDGATLSGGDADPVLERIATYKNRGITLLVVGCGAGAYQEQALQRLADHGDGQHVFLGSEDEARALFGGRLLPERLSVLARDAKVQVTWNKARVSHARLIGFEQRRLRDQDFRDDRVDAGEISHDAQATALFEVVLVDGAVGPLGTAAVRCFDTRLQQVRELPCPLPGSILAAEPSPRLRLLACAAETAEILQRGWWSNVKCSSWPRVRSQLARLKGARGAAALSQMVERAAELDGSASISDRSDDHP